VADLFQYEVMPKLEAEHERFFLTEYPVAEAALAQKNPDGRSAQRFEAYVNGLEICNGFTELVDPVEQRARFQAEAEERRLAGKEVFPIDEELLTGLASVRSPSFGNALGVDRLVMLKAGVKNIDAIHLFPPSLRF
jgi:lysyl-tRNA synthetase class 2